VSLGISRRHSAWYLASRLPNAGRVPFSTLTRNLLTLGIPALIGTGLRGLAGHVELAGWIKELMED